MRLLPRLLFVLLASLGVACTVTPQQNLCESQVADWVEPLMKQRQIPGLALGIGGPGASYWSQGFGFSNIENAIPVDAERTHFRIGSTSKALTAYGLVELVRAGKLDLDQPIDTYLPGASVNGNEITLRMLAGHTSGVRHYNSMSELGSLVQYDSVAASLPLFIDDPLKVPPNTDFLYSTYGYTLIAAVMESVHRHSFLQLMQADVFAKLGLSSTYPDVLGYDESNRSEAYYVNEGEITVGPPINSSYKWAGGGLRSSAKDLVEFASALLGEDAASIERRSIMWTEANTSSGDPTGYGVGWFVTDNYVEHPGGTVGGTVLLRVYPQEKIVIVLMANLSMIRSDPFGDVPDRLFECLTSGG